MSQHKVLTQKDERFSRKFDLSAFGNALNEYSERKLSSVAFLSGKQHIFIKSR